MKKLIALFLTLGFLFAGRVIEGTLAKTFTYDQGTVGATGTNNFFGTLPPKSQIVSVHVLMYQAFNVTTNTASLNMVALPRVTFTNVQQTFTNTFVSGFNLLRTDGVTVTLTNVGNAPLRSVMSSNATVPLWYTLTQVGAETISNGAGTIILRYIQY